MYPSPHRWHEFCRNFIGNPAKEEVFMNIIGVIGAGQMGSGIAQVAAQSGLNVILMDISEVYLDRGIKNISRNLDKMIERQKLTPQDKENVLKAVTATTSPHDFAVADIVIEAATEDEKLKLDIFKNLDAVCRPGCILATNTSSISITRLGGATKRADKVIGMHFMNPPTAMKLVEIIKGLATSQETYDAVKTLAEKMGKIILTAEDSAGFLVNRILLPMINEAIYCLQEGTGKAEDIDRAMKLGANHPMGPLELADLIGLDTCLAILHVLHNVLGEDKYRPCPLLIKYVDAGYLGRKSGRGFYQY